MLPMRRCGKTWRNRIGPELLPEAGALAVTYEDLADTLLGGKLQDRRHQILASQNDNMGVGPPGGIEVLLKRQLVVGGQVRLPDIRREEISVKSIDLPGAGRVRS